MKRRLIVILALAGMFLMSNCSEKAVTKYPFSPRQAKKIFEAKTSASLVPKQKKRQTLNQSAKVAVPFQQTKKRSI